MTATECTGLTTNGKAYARAKGPFFSIIIPAYNAEKYIEECLESTLSQGFSSFEVICIDDGSTDNTLHILKSFAEQDARIVVLEQKNQYAGIARNNALPRARGEYVIFLDSDDLLAPNALQVIYDSIRSSMEDVVLGGVDLFRDSPASAHEGQGWLVESHLPNCDSFAPSIIYPFIFNLSAGGPCGKCFKRTFVTERNLRFLDLPKSEDFYFVNASLAEASRLAIIHKPVYLKRNNENGLESQKDRYPIVFWDGVLALKNRLMEQGLLPLVEQSRVNDNITRFAYNLRELKTEAGRRAALDLLLEVHESELGLGLFPEEYYYRPDDYYYLLTCLHAEFGLEFDNLKTKQIRDEKQRKQQEVTLAQLEELKRIRHDFVQQETLLSEKSALLEARTKELQAANCEISNLQTTLSSSVEQGKHFEANLIAERKVSDQLKSEIIRLKQSNSWRIGRAITAPIRRLKKAESRLHLFR